MKLHMFDVIRQPSITEKFTQQNIKGKYAFEVHPIANKIQIKEAVEKIYSVHVTRVNTMNSSGKWRRVRRDLGKTAAWKRAVVTLKKGETIDITAS